MAEKFRQFFDHWSPKSAGEFFIVPRATEHMAVADDECKVLLLEPKGTLNTGDVRNERTVTNLQRI